MTGIAMQIQVFEERKPVFAREFDAPVELGRQMRDEDLYSAREVNADRYSDVLGSLADGPRKAAEERLRKSGLWRLVIAKLDEDRVSRRLALLEPLESYKIRLTNISSKVPIQLGDGAKVMAGESRELILPTILLLHPKTVHIRVPDSASASMPMQDSDSLIGYGQNTTSEHDRVPDLTPGSKLGQYAILETIGQGGMAHVYKAEDRSMKRFVAVKLLPKKYSAATMLTLFERELRVAGLLTHTNIVRAYHAGEHEGRPYLVSEYVDGTDLYRLVRTEGSVSLVGAIDFILQAARGLAHAHEHGVVHRDVKPSNLILDRNSRIQVLDFGLACFRRSLLAPRNYCFESDPPPDVSPLYGEPDMDSLASVFNLRTHYASSGDTESTLLQGLLVGTPAYMSPEQTYTSDVDLRSDIYSLGCCLHFLLCGRPLYQEATITEVLAAQRQKPIPSLLNLPGQIPARLDAAFQRMAAKRAEDRFQSMAAVIAEMQAILADLSAGPLLFLCYRREDSAEATQKLYEHLAARFGAKSVVMDIDTIPPGEDFRSFLEQAVKRCRVLLALIGDQWVKIRNERGRRLDDRMDYVRLEIATALDLKKTVIPVLVGKAVMPSPDELPRELRDLAFLQAVELRSGHGQEDQINRLIERVDEVCRSRT